MHHLLEQPADMATALLAGEKLRELILPGAQDDKAGALAALLLQLKLELPFDRVVTIGTVLVPILLVTLVFTKNFAGEAAGRGASAGVRGGRAVMAAPGLSQQILTTPILVCAAGRSGCPPEPLLPVSFFTSHLLTGAQGAPALGLDVQAWMRPGSGVGREDREGEWAGSEGRRRGQVRTRKQRYR